MNITVFQSDKGDCLLVTSEDQKRVLVDGGMSTSFSEHTSPFIGKMEKNGESLDVVYVSHIDADHISGILRMMNDKLDWAVFDYQKSIDNKRFREPKTPRPPEVLEIWHNAFDEQIGKTNTLELKNQLTTSASILFGSDSQDFVEMAESYQDLATGVNQGLQLNRRLGTKQLNIPINKPAEGELMMVEDQPSKIKVGSTTWTMIGPTKEDMDELEEVWDKWLKENKKALTKLEGKSQADEKKIGNLVNSEISHLINAAGFQANELGDDLRLIESDLIQNSNAKSKKIVFGKRSRVTESNLASLMFLVEEESADTTTSLLLTGDGHQNDILKGLEKAGKLDAEGCVHVDVLKVQHHGSVNNIDRAFLKKVTADNYLFCGNGGGHHKNPSKEVVDLVIDSRLVESHIGKHQKAADSPFKLSFNCNTENFDKKRKKTKTDVLNQAHMKELEKHVKSRQKKSQNRMGSFFLKGPHFTIKL